MVGCLLYNVITFVQNNLRYKPILHFQLFVDTKSGYNYIQLFRSLVIVHLLDSLQAWAIRVGQKLTPTELEGTELVCYRYRL